MAVKQSNTLRFSDGIRQDAGEIYHYGNVIVAGDVTGDFTLIADGYLLIKGAVKFAHLRAGGDLTVEGEMTNCHLVAGGKVIIRSLTGSDAHADGNLFVRGDVEKSRLDAGGQITVVGGEVRDGELFAARGLWVETVKCSAPRHTVLTAGWHFAERQKWAALSAEAKKDEAERQELVNYLGAKLTEIANKKLTGRQSPPQEVVERMRRLRIVTHHLEQINACLQKLESHSAEKAIIVCEKEIAVGVSVNLQRADATLTAPLTGIVSLFLADDANTISRKDEALLKREG
ncbi:hypothetical protein FACS1894107_16290 [Planctomycetales bacterium]|nr:hypothetical protein FACS1894107_16290 [Planctomycetales bacterium]GHS99933.1 hypothetical protein FACS1894108_10880 [Planctomycetales bacterium]GHV22291.1 hypothetical protein AGMMS49959_12840 [Planctomycetales bacterium]